MARVTVLKEDGKPVIAPGGRPKEIHSVDAMNRVRTGEFKAVYDSRKFGDETKNVFVAVRPITEADKQKERAEKQAQLEALQAELSGEPTPADTGSDESTTETPAPKTGRKPRTRQPRAKK